MSKYDEKVVTLIMAGGKGSRFWPLSRENYPKQFLSIDGNDSLLRQAYDRVKCFSDDMPYIVTNIDLSKLVCDSCKDINLEDSLILEPYGKNTAAAVLLSAMYIKEKLGNCVLAVFPADHYIDDLDLFQDTMDKAIAATIKTNGITIIGLEPTYPATGYGYIEQGKDMPVLDNDENILAYPIKRFVEKPNHQKASRYLKQGNYFWNSGIFIFQIDTILKAYEKYLPNQYEVLNEYFAYGDDKSEELLNSAYVRLESISFDHGILEKADNVYFIPGNFKWDDVGTYNSLDTMLMPDSNGNIIIGDVIAKDIKNSVIISDKPLLATLGLRDIVIVIDKDVALVTSKRRVEEVKGIVENLKNEGKLDFL